LKGRGCQCIVRGCSQRVYEDGLTKVNAGFR
jgi:hypothetical protein